MQVQRVAGILALALITGMGLAACGSDGEDGGGSGQTQATQETAPQPSPTEPPLLRVVVTNDDGVGAPGIDTLVTALNELPNIEVSVVAPDVNKSGAGGRTTPGELTWTEATTASGYQAVAVAGFPADTITVAFDELGLKPHLVISGINEGQNLGPVADLSGTIGAARAAARRGVPAIAVSQGFGEPVDFEAGAAVLVDWITEHRDDLLEDTAPQAVPNLNVPSCATGEVRGLLEIEHQPSVPDLALALQPQDCAATTTPTTEVDAFTAGYATLTEVPIEPATPVE